MHHIAIQAINTCKPALKFFRETFLFCQCMLSFSENVILEEYDEPERESLRVCDIGNVVLRHIRRGITEFYFRVIIKKVVVAYPNR